MPRDDPELDGLINTGKFNFFKISLISFAILESISAGIVILLFEKYFES